MQDKKFWSGLFRYWFGKSMINMTISPRVFVRSLICITLHAYVVIVAAGQTDVSDKAVVGDISRIFFERICKREVAAAYALWSGGSSELETDRRNIQSSIGSAAELRLRNFKIIRIEFIGAEALARVRAEIDSREVSARDEYHRHAIGSSNRFLRFSREPSGWKITGHWTVERDVADRVITATTQAERLRALELEADLEDEFLAFELILSGNALYRESCIEAAKLVYDAGLTVAERPAQYIGEQLPIYEDGLRSSVEIGDRQLEARFHLILGIFAIDYHRNPTRAIELYRKAIAISESARSFRTSALGWIRIGMLHTGNAEMAYAIEAANQAVDAARRSDDLSMRARALNLLGIVVDELGEDPERALAAFGESLQIERLLGRRSREATILYNMGNVYLGLSDFAKAMEYYQRSIERDGKLGYGTGMNIANLYYQQGNYGQALRYLKEINPYLDDVSTRELSASIYIATGEVHKAIDNLKIVTSEMEAQSRTSDVIQNLLRLGDAYKLIGDSEQELASYERALRLGEQVRNGRLLIEILISLSRSQLARNQPQASLDSALRARSFAEKIAGQTNNDLLLTALGRAYLGLGKTPEARTYFEAAVAAIEAKRARVAGDATDRQIYFETRLDAYEALIGLNLAEGRPGVAFDFAERSKARVLAENLQSPRMNLRSGLTSNEREKELALKRSIVDLNTRVASADSEINIDANQLTKMKEDLRNKRSEFEALEAALFVSHPELRLLRAAMKPITLRETGYLLQDRSTAIVEFSVARDQLFAFAISGDVNGAAIMQTSSSSIDKAELTRRVAKLRDQVETRDPDFRLNARALYDLLIKPLEGKLSEKASLIIVPDGPLWDLPFHALMDETGKYLIEKVAVSYAPSLTALREMRKKSSTRKPSANAELLAFGNPIVAAQTKARVQRVFMNDRLESIPEAGRLVNELGKMYGPKRSKVFTGADAREETAKIESPNYRIVQFSTHGILNNVSPMYSHLVMAQDPKNPKEDGLLEAWELKDLDLKVDMVILSACETARGKIANGEGIIGMTWASFIAGAPTTVASQWKVESSSTTELMLEFHRQLLAKKRVSKAEALRRASLKLLKMPQYRHPRYWGSFVLVGDGS